MTKPGTKPGKRWTNPIPLLAAALATLATPLAAGAHCDTLDGPVVTTALGALESGKLAPVLAWVQPGDEAEIKEAFARVRAARKTGKEAREVADRWFLETLVRVHRAGEGAPYTGLKPAGGPVDPAVAATDRAIAARDPAGIEALLARGVHEGLEARWARLAAEKPPADDVAAGRRWVAAYVTLTHWAEGVHGASAAAAHGERAPEDHAAHAQHRGAVAEPAHARHAEHAAGGPAAHAPGGHAH
jgi:hypothetical protein